MTVPLAPLNTIAPAHKSPTGTLPGVQPAMNQLAPPNDMGQVDMNGAAAPQTGLNQPQVAAAPWQQAQQAQQQQAPGLVQSRMMGVGTEIPITQMQLQAPGQALQIQPGGTQQQFITQHGAIELQPGQVMPAMVQVPISVVQAQSQAQPPQAGLIAAQQPAAGTFAGAQTRPRFLPPDPAERARLGKVILDVVARCGGLTNEAVMTLSKSCGWNEAEVHEAHKQLCIQPAASAGVPIAPVAQAPVPAAAKPPAAGGRGQPKPLITDALAYLDQVKKTFTDFPKARAPLLFVRAVPDAAAAKTRRAVIVRAISREVSCAWCQPRCGGL